MEKLKILIINGDCIETNSSANLCHIAYIKGLVSLGYQVTLLSANNKGYNLDSSLKIPKEVKHYTFNGQTFYEKLSIKKNKYNSNSESYVKSVENEKVNLKQKIIKKVKNMFLNLYGVHGIYIKFVRKAKKFKSDELYDYIISISTPVTSHLLAYKLIKSNHIKGKHWIQIWEDPWYSDAYGFNNKEKIFREEKKLLSYAEKICYVSPLTLKNQQRIFKESASKMYWQPLPFYYIGENFDYTSIQHNQYGYFGNYLPSSRNLKPFYEAAREMKIHVNICGFPNNLFTSVDNIHIYSRLNLDELKPLEDKTNVLVFLCNLKGGQIPGKIYQYSATNKIILFILDGTEEEKSVLKEYFGKYNRYVFCENNVEDIKKAISLIEKNQLENINNNPILDFNPQDIIENVLKME